jgi:hypothetical protein
MFSVDVDSHLDIGAHMSLRFADTFTDRLDRLTGGAQKAIQMVIFDLQMTRPTSDGHWNGFLKCICSGVKLRPLSGRSASVSRNKRRRSGIVAAGYTPEHEWDR